MVPRIVRIGLLLLAGLAWVAAPVPAGAGAEEPGDTLKVVVHINFPETGRQGHGLKNITKILAEDPGAQVELVCHGAGIGLVEAARTEHAEAVAALIEQGVRIVACENTMRQKSIRREDLLPGVGTVPSGAVEVIRKQQRDGFAYFRP